jgi:hypothetical protein
VSEPDSFLSRWSRRKRETLAPAPPEVAAELPATETAQAIPPDGATPEAAEPALAEPSLSEEELAQLPPLDEIAAETDLAPFLRAGVPRLLRNAALRRMWSVDPTIRDYLNDAREYAYDWNVPGGVPGTGPLLPTDDVAKLLQRVMRGSGPEPEADPAAQPAEAIAPDPDAPVIAAAEGEDDQVATPVPLPEPSPEIEIAVAVAAPLPVLDTSPPERLLRRHGGAIPN